MPGHVQTCRDAWTLPWRDAEFGLPEDKRTLAAHGHAPRERQWLLLTGCGHCAAAFVFPKGMTGPSCR